MVERKVEVRQEDCGGEASTSLQSTSMAPPTVADAFDRVVQWIRDTPVTPDLDTVTTDQKLRMYGLYKLIKDGPMLDDRDAAARDAPPPPPPPSIFRVQAFAKYQAYKKASDERLTKDEAMHEYISLAAGQSNRLGERCKVLMDSLPPTSGPDEVGAGQAADEMGTSHAEQFLESSSCLSHRDSESESMPTAGDTVQTSVSLRVASWFGLSPLVPRGQLDVAVSDLAFAGIQCMTMSTSTPSYRRAEGRIREHCQGQLSSSASTSDVDVRGEGRSVVVGLAVRSLLDAYLTSKMYPRGSRVILAPPVSVPGMLHVFDHHGISLDPVDLPAEGSIAVDVASVEKAVTPMTVAIMIVHPFGMKCIEDWGPLRALASKNKLHLLEDSAESYTGDVKTTVSPEADLSFVSFGLIKSATALGGGVAIVNDTEVARAMDQVQWNLYVPQPWLEYLWNVAKAFLLLLGSLPLVYGFLSQICISVGVDFDLLVTRAVRSFSNPSDPQKRLKLLRRRPTPALLSLLHRRLTNPGSSIATRRGIDCKLLTEKIRRVVPESVAYLGTKQSTFWLYPVVVKAPQVLRAKLFERGIDSTQGLTQLRCIDDDSCPRTGALMQQILYIPSTGLTRNCLLKLVDALQDLSVGREERFVAPKKLIDLPYRFCILFACFVIVPWFSDISLHTVVGLFFIAVAPVAFVICFVFSCGALLQWSIGAYYLETSSGFARFNNLMSDRLKAVSRGDAIPVNESLVIASDSPQLQFPSMPSQDRRVVFLTGATGFIGSMILRDLLLNRDRLSIQKIILLCRPKRGLRGAERIDRLLQNPEFSFVCREVRESVIKVVEGDVTETGVGLSAPDLVWLRQEASVSHVFHCAASVSFTQRHEDAARTNIGPALALHELAASLRRDPPVKLAHISTAFVHGDLHGSATDPLGESLFPLGDYDPQSIYSSMLGTQFYASKAMSDFGFHNTYTFSKCVCEHLLSRCAETGVETMVFRPTIVGPAIECPYEGWAGTKPSTLVAAACLYLSYQWNIWSFGSQPVPCIPVDVASRYIIRKAFDGGVREASISRPCHNEEEEYSSDGSFEKVGESVQHSKKRITDRSATALDHRRRFRVINVAWDTTSPLRSSFTWLQFAVAVTQLGSVQGFFGRPTALFGLLITTRFLPKANLTINRYRRLHSLLVLYPFRLYQMLGSIFGVEKTRMSRLASFLDLPLLFYPFMNGAYFFQSELVAPDKLDGSRYLFSCAVAAASFMLKATVPRQDDATYSANCMREHGLSFLPVGGEKHPPPVSDLWWACTQPRGGFFIRAGAWILARLFRAICSVLTVDVTSFTSTASAIDSNNPARVILAPTHRSMLDFLVVGFVVFSIPELQIEFPLILAADDFEKLPFLGFLAAQMHAIFVRRGRKRVDPELLRRTNAATTVEVFIEGSRSRDRRFLEAKTGFLRGVCRQEGKSLIVPIAVNYERIAEQSLFASEIESGRMSVMSLVGLAGWLLKVWKKEVHLGNIHVVACEPLLVTNASEPYQVAKEIQARQQSRVQVSRYHVDAMSQLLSIEKQTVVDELSQLGCTIWPYFGVSKEQLMVPDNHSELVSVALQAAPFLASAVYDTKTRWARWLQHDVTDGLKGSVTEIPKALCRLLDEADAVVDEAFVLLRNHGYKHPSSAHVLQAALELQSSVAPILLRASVSIRECEGSLGDTLSVGTTEATHRLLLSKSNESLGFWGFHDSAFVVQTDCTGSIFVTMKGSRYSLCGRRIAQLLPFIENEMKAGVNLSREVLQHTRSTLPKCALSQIDVGLLRTEIGEVSVSDVDRIRHGTGHCQKDVYLVRNGTPPRVPDAVVWPSGEAQVRKLVEMAATKSWCLIPFGGGTNVSQSLVCPPHCVEPRPIISVDLQLMNRILWIDEENGLARVEAGILGRTLAMELSIRGYTMGHEPDSIEFSTLGGWIATKSSGMKRSRYGNIEDIVKSVTVCCANGVSQHGDPDACTWGRESTGSNVHDLLFGSEGSLGIITSAVIRVWPLPDITEHEGIVFADFDAGFAFVRDVSRRLEGRMPASVRLLDNAHFRLGQALVPTPEFSLQGYIRSASRVALQMAYGLDWTRAVCATITYEGDRISVAEQRQAISAIAGAHGGIRLGSEAGRAGYELTYMIAYLRDFALTYQFLGESFETFAPWSKARTIVQATTDRLRREHAAQRLPGRPFVGCRVTQLYHEGACLYFYLCISIENVPDPSRVFADLEHAARQVILENGGSLSHHHGIGKARCGYLEGIQSTALQSNLEAVKKAMDPENIFGARNGLFACRDRMTACSIIDSKDVYS